MEPSETFGLVPKFGIEIEVVSWKKVTRKDICKKLIANEYMPEETNWSNGDFHNYHCDCRYCERWNTGKIPWPIQVALQYDASLPDSGGEFITSPMLCTELYFNALEEVWDVICKQAEWRTDVPNRRGGASSPSIHVHVSVDNPFVPVLDPTKGRDALWLFMPELFKIASVCGIQRGIEYRQPHKEAGHHSALNIRAMGNRRGETPPRRAFITDATREAEPNVAPGRETIRLAQAADGNLIFEREPNDPTTQPPGFDQAFNQVMSRLERNRQVRPTATSNASARYEWRMFEAAYQDFEYTKGVIVLASALTQLAVNPETAGILQSAGQLVDPKKGQFDQYEDFSTYEEIMEFYSPKRFAFMSEIVLASPLVMEDKMAMDAIQALFSRVPEKG